MKAQGSGDAGMAGQGQAGQTSQGLFAPGREPNSRSGAVTTVTLVIQVAAQIGGSTRGCTALADHALRPVADADALAVPCRTSGPCGWQSAQGHRRPQPRGATTLSGKQMTPPRPRRPGGSCSTTLVVAGVRGAIYGQVVALDVHSSRPKRRSDDGQTILKAALMGWRLGSHLGKLVELRGFEPRTSCMP